MGSPFMMTGRTNMDSVEGVIKIIRSATAWVIAQQDEVDTRLVPFEKQLGKIDSFSLNNHREEIQPYIDRLYSQFANLIDEVQTRQTRLRTACDRLVREKDEVDPSEYDGM